MTTGRPLRLLSPDDPLKESPYIAVAELSGGRDGRNDILQLGAPLSLTAIRNHLSAEVRVVENVFWAPASKAVLGRKQQRLGALVLSEEAVAVSDDKALPVLFKVRLLWTVGFVWRLLGDRLEVIPSAHSSFALAVTLLIYPHPQLNTHNPKYT